MELLLVGLAVGAISFNISITSIFLSFREWVSKIHPKIDDLVHCPWCLSHWITLFMYIIMPSGKDDQWSWYTMICIYFSIVTISGVVHFILLRAYDPVIQMKVARKLQKLNAERKNQGDTH